LQSDGVRAGAGCTERVENLVLVEAFPGEVPGAGCGARNRGKNPRKNYFALEGAMV